MRRRAMMSRIPAVNLLPCICLIHIEITKICVFCADIIGERGDLLLLADLAGVSC